MNAENRKRLEASGWATTTVQELLNLDKVDMKRIENKLALTKAVREQRHRKHITQIALATTSR